MSVKQKVWDRDGGRCVVCGNSYNVMPNAHILSRSKGGLGIETNIVTLCTNLTQNQCHYRFDNGTKKEHDKILKIITNYMKSIYPDWNIEDQKYKKWSDKR
jgi:5-methylcytosine-specific restriction endonuclease McrA